MRILVDALSLNRPESGVQRYVRRLLQGLASRGDVDLLAAVPRQVHVGIEDGLLQARVGRSRLLRIGWQQVLFPFAARRLSPDVIHHPAYTYSVLHRVVARRPVVLTVHDTIALDMPRLVPRVNRLHFRVLMTSALKHSAYIVVPTRHVFDRLVAHGVSPSRMEVVPWGVSPPSGGKERSGVPGFPFVLHVGTFEAKKNIGTVVKGFFAAKSNKRLPHKLVLAGRPGPALGEVVSLVKSTNLVNDVFFCLDPSDDMLAELYRRASLVVSASLEEGFGFVPLEALLCGCPVVVSSIPAHDETLGGYVPMFAPTDLVRLRELVEEMLADERRCREVVESGRQAARRYTWEGCIDATVEIYNRCVSSFPSS